jgi:membrane associated rhomboid family serine protease
MLFVLLALTPGTDVIAHLGGFVSGLVLGALMNLVPAIAQKPKTNVLSGLLFALLVLVPWWLALRANT